MKWYFASRTRHKKKLAKTTDFLESIGENVLSEWVNIKLFTSYEQNLSEVHKFSRRIVKSLLDTDVLVLISDPGGTDMFIELGVCLALKEFSNNNRLYIVGEYSKRSLMQLHPTIIHVNNLEGVFKAEGINYEGFNVPQFI